MLSLHILFPNRRGRRGRSNAQGAGVRGVAQGHRHILRVGLLLALAQIPRVGQPARV
jgi:hypothetical protein